MYDIIGKRRWLYLFSLLVTILERFHDHPIGAWLRKSTLYAGILLILFGAYFTFRTFFAFEAG